MDSINAADAGTNIIGSVNTAITTMVGNIGDAIASNVPVELAFAGGIVGLFLVWRVGKRLVKA